MDQGHSTEREASSSPLDKNTVDYTHKLLDLMRQRRGVLGDLRELAERQAVAATNSEAGVTLGILARKDALIDELMRISLELDVYRDDDPERRRWESPELRAECQRIANEGEELLRKAVELEQQTLTDITVQREAVAAQLQNGSDSRMAQNAYAAGQTIFEGSLDLNDL